MSAAAPAPAPVSPSVAGFFRTSRPYAAIPLDPFRALPPEAWSEGLFRADELVDAVVTARAADVLAALGPDPDAHVAPARRPALDWLRRKVAAGATGAAPAALDAAILAEGDALGSTFDLIDEAARAYPAWLRGEVDGATILFGRAGALARWERYFTNRNRSYAAVNLLAAAAADAATAGRAGLRVLEVGGGLASGAEALLARLRPRVAAYTFTEIAPSFLRRGAETLAARHPDLALATRRVDLDAPLARQGVPGGAFDLVFAVNTLHVVRDLEATLRELRAALAPGGRIVLGEGVRAAPGRPVAIEFVFQLLGLGGAGAGGFLHWREWPAALERAGFRDVRTTPDLDAAIRAYPGYSIAAIAATTPGAPAAPAAPAA